MMQAHAQRLFAIVLLFGSLLTLSQGSMAGGLPDFTEMVDDNAPAVVNISTLQHVKGRLGLPHGFQMPDLPEDSPFNDFFRRFFDEMPGGEQERQAQSLGSGFIISEDGYILTNRHVVDGADEIVVRLADRKSYDAKVIGSDKASDVALLKIDAENLPTLRIGSSSKLKVGEWVLAIGSPFGFDHTVTAGIVSAKGRSLPTENYVPFIQTDVAINPGNSGGPLFNMDGKVVGINSQIYSRTGGFMGLSFAIPIELAMDVAQQLRT
jgi:serine protease Do